MMDQIKKLVQKDLDAVNAVIMSKIDTNVEFADQLGQYILNSGGKRVRPLIALLSSYACGYKGELHIPLAAMVEFFHTATLLHDDVVDDSTLRRGQKTANHLWGNKASILVGDFLFTQSIQLLLESKHTAIQELFARTAHEVSLGELQQLAGRGDADITVENYLAVIRSKTAVLFAAAAAIGPLLQPECVFEQAFYQYGLHLGNAFQLIDDALDYCADAATMGKNNGDDLADGKVTLPLLHVLKYGSDLQKQLIKNTLASGSRAHFDEIMDAIETTGAIEYTRCAAHREKTLAIDALSEVPDSAYKQALIQLVTFVLERNH